MKSKLRKMLIVLPPIKVFKNYFNSPVYNICFLIFIYLLLEILPIKIGDELSLCSKALYLFCWQLNSYLVINKNIFESHFEIIISYILLQNTILSYNIYNRGLKYKPAPAGLKKFNLRTSNKYKPKFNRWILANITNFIW